MKKAVMFAGLSIFSLGLVACSNNSDSGETKDSSKAEVIKQTSNDLSKKEVLQKMSEASEKLTSAEITSNITSSMTMNDQTTDTKATSVVQYILDPFVMKTETEDSASGQKIVTYMDDKNSYMQIPGSDQWQTYELSSMGIDVASQMEKVNSSDILKELDRFTEDMKLEKQDNTYILSYEGKGDALKDIVAAEASSGDSETDLEAASEGLDVNTFNYQMVIDDKTFNPISYELEMDYVISSEALEMKMKQQHEATFDKINEIKEIKLPDVE